MNSPFVVCASCNCHVRAAARTCPHCHANLVAPGALRLIRAARKELRRRFLPVALAGMGMLACGTVEPYGDGNGVSGSAASNGSESSGADSGLDSGLADAGPVDAGLDPNVWGTCTPGQDCVHSCGCGWDGHCNGQGQCINCGCDAGYCTYAGYCSTHTCYGAPPLIGVDQGARSVTV